jgi:hypothetical protein
MFSISFSLFLGTLLILFSEKRYIFLISYILFFLINIGINYLLKIILKHPRPNENMDLFHFIKEKIDYDRFGTPSLNSQSCLFSSFFILFSTKNLFYFFIYLFLSFYVIYEEIRNNISYYYQVIIAGIIGITISIITYQLSLFFLKGKVELKEEENAPEIRGLL